MADVDAEIEEKENKATFFNKKLNKLLNRARIQNGAISVIGLLVSSIGLTSALVLPTLLQDIFGMADQWGGAGESGRIDPFVEVYDVSLEPYLSLDPAQTFTLSLFTS
jgi:hypothetical protein